jgi:hypothetical protein
MRVPFTRKSDPRSRDSASSTAGASPDAPEPVVFVERPRSEPDVYVSRPELGRDPGSAPASMRQAYLLRGPAIGADLQPVDRDDPTPGAQHPDGA